MGKDGTLDIKLNHKAKIFSLIAINRIKIDSIGKLNKALVE